MDCSLHIILSIVLGNECEFRKCFLNGWINDYYHSLTKSKMNNFSSHGDLPSLAPSSL